VNFDDDGHVDDDYDDEGMLIMIAVYD